MRANNRRDFLKKSVLAGASLFTVPSFLSAIPNSNIELSQVLENTWESKSDTLLNNGLKITGTFLDEISHDIPHQNWGVREWERDFQYMKGMGIDTVILIRSGYRKFITYPSEYLLKKGCYMPSVDLVDMFLNLADKYDMIFYFGLYDSGRYWDTGELSWEVEEIGQKLGKQIAGLINLFNPELVIIGGTLSLTGDYITQPIKTAVRKYSLNLVNKDSVIITSKLKDKAGIVGACMLARSRMFES